MEFFWGEIVNGSFILITLNHTIQCARKLFP